jgi:hypothetical protein
MRVPEPGPGTFKVVYFQLLDRSPRLSMCSPPGPERPSSIDLIDSRWHIENWRDLQHYTSRSYPASHNFVIGVTPSRKPPFTTAVINWLAMAVGGGNLKLPSL